MKGILHIQDSFLREQNTYFGKQGVFFICISHLLHTSMCSIYNCRRPSTIVEHLQQL